MSNNLPGRGLQREKDTQLPEDTPITPVELSAYRAVIARFGSDQAPRYLAWLRHVAIWHRDQKCHNPADFSHCGSLWADGVTPS